MPRSCTFCSHPGHTRRHCFLVTRTGDPIQMFALYMTYDEIHDARVNLKKLLTKIPKTYTADEVSAVRQLKADLRLIKRQHIELFHGRHLDDETRLRIRENTERRRYMRLSVPRTGTPDQILDAMKVAYRHAMTM